MIFQDHSLPLQSAPFGRQRCGRAAGSTRGKPCRAPRSGRGHADNRGAWRHGQPGIRTNFLAVSDSVPWPAHLSPGPILVVCDEPVSALDASVQAQTLNLLRDVQEQFEPRLPVYFARSCRGGLFVPPHHGYVSRSDCGRSPTEALFEGAAHPYTQALMAAILTGSRRGEPLPRWKASCRARAPPAGCRFHPRCPKAKDICRQEAPQWKEMGAGWRVRCWLA